MTEKKGPENISQTPGGGVTPSGEELSLPMKENVVPDRTRAQGSTIPPYGHDHEYKDISFRSVVRFAVYIAVLAVVVHLLLWGMFEIMAGRAEAADVKPAPLQDPHKVPPPPRLQVDEHGDLASFRRREDSLLGSYGWIDQKGGRAKIPVDRAMELLVASGGAVAPASAGAGDTAARADSARPNAK